MPIIANVCPGLVIAGCGDGEVYKGVEFGGYELIHVHSCLSLLNAAPAWKSQIEGYGQLFAQMAQILGHSWDSAKPDHELIGTANILALLFKEGVQFQDISMESIAQAGGSSR